MSPAEPIPATSGAHPTGSGESVVRVVGIGADGWDGLPPASRTIIGTAQVLVGGTRQLGLVPQIPGQDRVAWPSPLRPALPGLFESLTGRSVAVLASGDPLVSGIGSTLVRLLGSDRVQVVPAVSSVALAAAAMNWAAESFDVVTVVGRNPGTVVRSAAPGHRVIVLSSDGSTPAHVAELLTDAGYGPSRLTVLADLGTAAQSRIDAVAESFPATDLPALNVVAVQCVAAVGTVPLSIVGGLPDDAFEHDGQLTKRDARASALARLTPLPGQLLWDVGAGAGSIGIEWCRADPRCRAVAIERDPVRAERIARNAGRLGVPGLQVVTGAAPAAVAGLETPDAVFVGGGATSPGVLDTCWAALGIGGRMVVHGVTVETESLLVTWHGRWGGELLKLAVERVEPIGSFRGWAPARPIVQWTIAKPAGSAAEVTP